MWRVLFTSPTGTKAQLLHGIFVLILCVTVLIRDNFAHFMRFFAMRTGPEPELREFTRLRTIVAAPIGTLLYAHAFYVPGGPTSLIYIWISWLGNLHLRVLFFNRNNIFNHKFLDQLLHTAENMEPTAWTRSVMRMNVCG